MGQVMSLPHGLPVMLTTGQDEEVVGWATLPQRQPRGSGKKRSSVWAGG